jgi:formylglycine-generating enzyme required for sulfatase activity
VLARNRNAIGGFLGLALLVLAFAYRWVVPPEWLQPGPASVPTPTATHAAPVGDAGTVARLGTSDTESSDAEVEVAEVPEPTPDDMPPEPLDAAAESELRKALERAGAAIADGRLLTPADDNALYWYDAALAIDARDAAARRGRRSVLDAALAAVESALDAGDAETATEWLEALAAESEIAQARARLITRRDALPAVEAALVEGARRLAAGQVFEPAGASALDSYRSALEIDARNLAAREGLASIESSVLSRAMTEASEDRFEEATRLLAMAAEFLPGTQAQLEARTRILSLRRDRAAVFVSRATLAIDAGSADTAEQLLARAEALGADAAAVAALRDRLIEVRVYERFKPGERFSDNLLDRSGNGPEMVVLPVGEFQMGSPESEEGRKVAEGPRYRVRIARPFALARTELTVAEFRNFVRDSNYVTDAERIGTSSYYDESSGRISNGKRMSWRRNYAGEPARDREPVVHLSWNDANAYAAWLAERTGQPYRLPTEAEFEYALRAGTSTKFPWGEGEPEMVVGNFTGDGDRSKSRRSWSRAFTRYSDGHWGPARVGSFPANRFGLHDLEGNVSEWVEDCWHDSYVRAPTDGSAWVNRGCTKRVVRGGSWGSAPDQVRSAYRVSASAETRSGRIGIRVARSLGTL